MYRHIRLFALFSAASIAVFAAKSDPKIQMVTDDVVAHHNCSLTSSITAAPIVLKKESVKANAISTDLRSRGGSVDYAVVRVSGLPEDEKPILYEISFNSRSGGVQTVLATASTRMQNSSDGVDLKVNAVTDNKGKPDWVRLFCD